MQRTASIAAFLVLTARAQASEAFGGGVYYVGDLHAHTGYSGDAGSADLGNCTGECGNFSDVFTTARANGLDFLAITDHVNGGSAISAADFGTLNAAVIAADDPAGGFVTLPAAELWFTVRSTADPLGHKTLLLFGDDATLTSLQVADMRIASGTAVTDCDEIWSFMSALSATWGDALLLPHHPAVQRPMATDWDCHDATWGPSVEIYSEHGNSLDDGTYDVPGEGIYTDSTVEAALDPDRYGLMFGFVAGTDSHDTLPGEVCEQDTEQPTHLYAGGLTLAVLDPSETFDRPALHDAIVERRTLVTTGPALPMEIAWSSGGVLLGGLGESLDVPESLDLDVQVTVPADRAATVTGVELIGPAGATWSLTDDGSGAWSGVVPAGDVPAFLFVGAEIDGVAWYGAGGCDDGGDDVEWVWSSPSPIALWLDDTDGDGYSVLADDCDDSDASVFPGAPETWYDGVDQDCDEGDDYDQDVDGYDTLGTDADCRDTDATVYPGASDAWYDGTDANCDGSDDYDQDGDGYPLSPYGTDCDDMSAQAWPGAAEVWYDGVDQDCDPATEYDQDGDGHEQSVDCDDLDADRFVGATEIWYDGVDQDCDDRSDHDQDGDTFDRDVDCDDTLATAYPGAPEVWYDGIDQDCDGNDADQDGDGYDLSEDCDDLDADVSPLATDAWYDGLDQDCDGASDWDQDGDGFDSEAWAGTDCDDTDAAIYPGAPELPYDAVDQDCGGLGELDADGDGVPVGLDCFDHDPRRYACPSTDEPSTCGAPAPTWVWLIAAAGLFRRSRRIAT